MVCSTIDIFFTWINSRYFLFFSISFYNTNVPWISLALGDFVVKLLMALLMLIPFKILLKTMPNEIQFSRKIVLV